MLKRIKVYGRLKKFLKWDNGTFEADVRSFADVMSFLKANWPEIKGHMSKQQYQITVADRELDIEQLQDPIGETEEIKIVPVMIGAKGAKKFIAGAILVGIVVATGGFGGAAIGLGIVGGGSIAIGTIVAGIGVSLMLSGISEVLTPTPESPTDDVDKDSTDPSSNYQFSGVQNISRSGIPISLIYGWEVIVGSVVVSNGIDTAQIKGTA